MLSIVSGLSLGRQEKEWNLPEAEVVAVKYLQTRAWRSTIKAAHGVA
jgi:hypothetical protein